jgi:ribosomal protein L40E
MHDIKEKLLNITRSVSKTSGDLLKTTKLGMNVSTEESNLKNLYIEIGKKVHEIYQYGGSLGKFFDEKYLEIEACERKIADIKEQISVIKGTRVCVKCGKTMERTAEFCQKCGVRMEFEYTPAEEEYQAAQQPQQLPPPVETVHAPPPVQPPPAPIPVPSEPETAIRVCRVCNSKNDFAAKFCLSCGRILE